MKIPLENPVIISGVIAGMALLANGIFTSVIIFVNSWLDRRARVAEEKQKREDGLLSALGQTWGRACFDKYGDDLCEEDFLEIMIEYGFDNNKRKKQFEDYYNNIRFELDTRSKERREKLKKYSTLPPGERIVKMLEDKNVSIEEAALRVGIESESLKRTLEGKRLFPSLEAYAFWEEFHLPPYLMAALQTQYEHTINEIT